MFLMTLRRLEVRLLINTRQREQREGRGGEGRWLGARIEVERKGVEKAVSRRGKERRGSRRWRKEENEIEWREEGENGLWRRKTMNLILKRCLKNNGFCQILRIISTYI